MHTKMPSFSLLIEELEKSFPEDWWLASRRESARVMPENIFPQVAVYEQALGVLDNDSWETLKEKAIKVFSEPKGPRGKGNFFNLLNEALAYEFLYCKGFNNVRFFREIKKRKTPDLSFSLCGITYYCEVKSIGVSDAELLRTRTGEVYSGSIYTSLNHNFFAKLCSTIRAAIIQIESVLGEGVIYLIIHFDDFTLDYYETYEKQIAEFLEVSFPENEVIVRVGIENSRYILHGQNKGAKLRA